jgi:hypothetical protein
LSYEGDAEIGQQNLHNRHDNNNDNNNNDNNNNQSGYARLVTFMIVILSLLAVVTLSAGAYVGKTSSSISNSVDTSVTTTTTDSIISSVVPDSTGIINSISASDWTYNPTPTGLSPTPSPVEEIDINTAKGIVKEVKEKKEIKEAQNKGKLIDTDINTSSSV